MAYGPMKPVGLPDPSTGQRPYAVLQLRREDASGSMYNMVGFQTKLTHPEQERVFRMIPGLSRAIFLRHGSIHRNTYINSPGTVTPALNLASMEKIFVAGQITGVEGYVESTAMGLLAGISACMHVRGMSFEPPPHHTCAGALLRHITTERKGFQPMNINFGLLPDYNKREKERIIERALESIARWGETIGPLADHGPELEDRQIHRDNEPPEHNSKEDHDHRLHQCRKVGYHGIHIVLVKIGYLVEHIIERPC